MTLMRDLLTKHFMNSKLRILTDYSNKRLLVFAGFLFILLEFFVVSRAVVISNGYEAYAELTLTPHSLFLNTPLVDDSAVAKALNRCRMAVSFFDVGGTVSSWVRSSQHVIGFSAEGPDKSSLVKHLNFVASSAATAQNEYNEFVRKLQRKLLDSKTSKDSAREIIALLSEPEQLVFFEAKLTVDASATARKKLARGIVFLTTGTLIILGVVASMTYLVSSTLRVSSEIR